MNRSLRYISISHKIASVTQRQEFHIPEEKKDSFTALIRDTFPDITGLLLLVTCNRTEIYFESSETSAAKLRNFLISSIATGITEESRRLFDLGDDTEKTVRHLLGVSSGLESTVLGDAEIIHQIKKAHQFSIAHQLQGSLLERAMQAIFKCHKRVSNETHFRDGTTSVAYKSLKVIHNSFSKANAKTKKILVIGAGDIVKELFRYNSKFNFNTIYVSNRTEERARALASEYHCKVYEWKKVLANDFENFDVIVSAASNCHHLVKNIPVTSRKLLLIDLAVPSNIDRTLADNTNFICYDIDAISKDLDDTKERRLAATGEVEKIMAEEFSAYNEWLREAPRREFLAELRILIAQKVKDHFIIDEIEQDAQFIKTTTNSIMKKLIGRKLEPLPTKEIDSIVREQISLRKETFV